MLDEAVALQGEKFEESVQVAINYTIANYHIKSALLIFSLLRRQQLVGH